MRLASFRAGGAASYGIVTAGGVVDAGRRLSPTVPDLKSALAVAMDALRRLAEAPVDHRLDAVEWLPVVPNPDKLICIGINYMTHVKETGRPIPDYPMVFTRFANSQVGHGQPILRPPESEKFDYEGELAVVIGTAGRRIPRERALAHVAGYACYNDGSIRDWQRHSVQYTPGKNFEASGAFGPWMVTADEIPDPAALTLTTRLNGQVMQHAPVSDLIFDVPALIAYLSTFTTLVPGDVIVTGTTGGVGAFREPPVWMKPGDTVEIDISGVAQPGDRRAGLSGGRDEPHTCLGAGRPVGGATQGVGRHRRRAAGQGRRSAECLAAQRGPGPARPRPRRILPLRNQPAAAVVGAGHPGHRSPLAGRLRVVGPRADRRPGRRRPGRHRRHQGGPRTELRTGGRAHGLRFRARTAEQARRVCADL
jgi:2-keto-4-pentenoate hydratase/2-oxohepta-3-ene-1,7-dioic acid hydratase in catechol pathway